MACSKILNIAIILFSHIFAIHIRTDEGKQYGNKYPISEHCYCLNQQTAKSYSTKQGQMQLESHLFKNHAIIRCKLCSTCGH